MITIPNISRWNDLASNAPSGICRIAGPTTQQDAESIAESINNTPKRRKYQEFRGGSGITSQEMTLVAKAIHYDGAWVVNGLVHKKSFCNCQNCQLAENI